jgi:hypothetical protein
MSLDKRFVAGVRSGKANPAMNQSNAAKRH